MGLQEQITCKEAIRKYWLDIPNCAEPTKEELDTAEKEKNDQWEKDREPHYRECGLKDKHITMTWDLWRSLVPPHVIDQEEEIKKHGLTITVYPPDVSMRVDFIVSEKKWLFLSGSTGTGKSATASLIAKAWCKAGKSVAFVTANEIQQALNSWKENENTWSMKDLKGVDYLVIDEMGRETATDAFYKNLNDILISRDADRKRTCFTSNLPIDMFMNRLDQAMNRRFADNTKFVDFD